MLPDSFRKKLNTIFITLNLGEECFNTAETDGFICAVAITPAEIPASEWITTIFDNKIPKLDSPEEGDRIRRVFTACYNDYQKQLAKNQPLYSYDLNTIKEEGIDEIIDWSWGFLTGLNLRMPIWEEESDIDGEDPDENPVRNSLAVIKALVYRDYDLVPVIKEIVEAHKGEKSEGELNAHIILELMTALPQAIGIIQEYASCKIDFSHKELELSKASKKIGRNEPCPCGSGKKYKKCCALKKDGQYLH